MELTAFRQSLSAAMPPEGLDSACVRSGTKARVIGSARTKSRRTRRAHRLRGSTPTCIARKAICPTPGTECRRAGKPPAKNSLEEEWAEIAAALLRD